MTTMTKIDITIATITPLLVDCDGEEVVPSQTAEISGKVNSQQLAHNRYIQKMIFVCVYNLPHWSSWSSIKT